jgi:hypothetical protein
VILGSSVTNRSQQSSPGREMLSGWGSLAMGWKEVAHPALAPLTVPFWRACERMAANSCVAFGRK